MRNAVWDTIEFKYIFQVLRSITGPECPWPTDIKACDQRYGIKVVLTYLGFAVESSTIVTEHVIEVGRHPEPRTDQAGVDRSTRLADQGEPGFRRGWRQFEWRHEPKWWYVRFIIPFPWLPEIFHVWYLSISEALDAMSDSVGTSGTGEMGSDNSAVTCSFIELKLGSIVRGWRHFWQTKLTLEDPCGLRSTPSVRSMAEPPENGWDESVVMRRGGRSSSSSSISGSSLESIAVEKVQALEHWTWVTFYSLCDLSLSDGKSVATHTAFWATLGVLVISRSTVSTCNSTGWYREYVHIVLSTYTARQ